MKKAKRNWTGALAIGGAVCVVLGLNIFVFPSVLDALTVQPPLKTTYAEDMPQGESSVLADPDRKEMTVFERIGVSTLPVKKAEPDANAISKEKAIEAATRAYEKTLADKKQEKEEWKAEVKQLVADQKKSIAEGDIEGDIREAVQSNQEYLEELERYDWSWLENPQKEIKYVAGNAPATEPMWVVSFETKSKEEELILKDNFLGGIESSLKQLAQPRGREKDPMLAQMFPDSTLTVEDYKNPELIGYEETTGEDGNVYVNFGKYIEYCFYNINAQTGEIISSESVGNYDKVHTSFDWFYEDQYGFNPGFDY